MIELFGVVLAAVLAWPLFFAAVWLWARLGKFMSDTFGEGNAGCLAWAALVIFVFVLLNLATQK